MTTKQKLDISRTSQYDIFSELSDIPEKGSVNHQGIGQQRRFLAPQPSDITIGHTYLQQHLEQAGQKTPIIVADFLNELDWSEFEARYGKSGRPPYAPRNMVGLILYGIMQGVTSLRGLEALARLNLGCMWVSGGIFPDHANIGRFVIMHAESLSLSFFEDLARLALKKTRSSGHCLAGDGTTIEAACSNYNLVKEEAARAALEEARRQAEKAPGDEEKQTVVEHKTVVLETLLTQKEKRRKRSQKAAENTMVSPTEPEAIIQKMKRGRGYAPGYTPSVLANEKRVVVAVAVDPTNETAVIPEMLDQAVRTTGQSPDELLLDGGYANETVITTTIDRDISLLCPESGKPGKPKKGKKFHKSRFRYDTTNDVYYCPGEQTLVLLYQPGKNAKADAARVYGGADCQNCPLQNRCTSSKKKGRQISRFTIDDAKDALRETMQHPAAKKVFKHRKAMVEPVFGHLRTVQGLNRFRRRGLSGVKLEFSLHLLAYNLSRVVAAAASSLILRLFYRLWCQFKAVLTGSNFSSDCNRLFMWATMAA